MSCSVNLCIGGWSLAFDIDSKSWRKVSCGRHQARQRKLSFVQKLDKSHVRHRCYQAVHKKTQSKLWHIQSGVISSRQTPPFMSAICPRSYILTHAMTCSAPPAHAASLQGENWHVNLTQYRPGPHAMRHRGQLCHPGAVKGGSAHYPGKPLAMHSSAKPLCYNRTNHAPREQ